MGKLLSTEQVSKWHPDKYADQISDAVLTYCLSKDINSKVACETMVKDNTVVLGGEITCSAEIPYDTIVRDVAYGLGYDVDRVINLISKQSDELNMTVGEVDHDMRAGDQGMMFGYACGTAETNYLPKGFDLANKLILRHEYIVNHLHVGLSLHGDAKVQVTTDEDDNVASVLISMCHDKKLDLYDIESIGKDLIAEPLGIDKKLVKVNTSGIWTVGGATADCGITGRKIVCDQYGGYCAVGGGAFSGKDPSKLDRSGAYMARHIAVDLIKEFGFKWAEVQLAYEIGELIPISVNIKNDQNADMSEWVLRRYDLTPYGIWKHLGLDSIDYAQLSEGCHYRYPNFPRVRK